MPAHNSMLTGFVNALYLTDIFLICAISYLTFLQETRPMPLCTVRALIIVTQCFPEQDAKRRLGKKGVLKSRVLGNHYKESLLEKGVQKLVTR